MALLTRSNVSVVTKMSALGRLVKPADLISNASS